MVVFTSDHGEMLRDHGYFRKCQPFEGSANVPFVIAGSSEMGFRKGIRIGQAGPFVLFVVKSVRHPWSNQPIALGSLLAI